MLKKISILILCILFTGALMAKDNPVVVFETTMGNIELELYPDKAPMGVENFLNYVNSGFYNNTIFHRVIKNFVIQGGGFDAVNGEKETGDPIMNEATNGLKNVRGSICYARTSDIHSATSQFFINHRDNTSLDHTNNTQSGYGYAVFGKVISGMDVVDKIANVKTGKVKLKVSYNGQLVEYPMADVPLEPVIVKVARVVIPEEKK